MSVVLRPVEPYAVGARWCALMIGLDTPSPVGHIFPLNDLQPHTETDCECGAVLDVTAQPPCWRHAAFDGRDIVERVERGETV